MKEATVIPEKNKNKTIFIARCDGGEKENLPLDLLKSTIIQAKSSTSEGEEVVTSKIPLRILERWLSS